MNFTKSCNSSKIGITLCTATFQGLLACKTYSAAFFEFIRSILQPLYVVS